MNSMAEVLYEHWRNSSGGYELKRQPEFENAAPNLKRVFEAQADALAKEGFGDAQSAWDAGLLVGHNNPDRLVDKWDLNPYKESSVD